MCVCECERERRRERERKRKENEKSEDNKTLIYRDIWDISKEKGKRETQSVREIVSKKDMERVRETEREREREIEKEGKRSQIWYYLKRDIDAFITHENMSPQYMNHKPISKATI